ncbi:Ppx/GppA phosphatase family protein [Actomonas aquatica]|uniref:Phosphatase n=1 Tax=Actomonas aquatica TaxID=2866162 RepID=A0ABZ1C933_9BACT|nr:phosphatase [Opitutus sp. WL0086]WRQ88011.1 phosphatase [Opitutus sp. WL0086]
MMLVSPSTAVIDIGSNSIKALVATRREDGRIVALEQRTLDTRIGTGLNADQPRLTAEAMAAGAAAVAELAAMCRAHEPNQLTVVATSAVRDSANGAEFAARIQSETGLELRILSGDEEARYIGRGLLCDPALAAWTDFHVFDLGGGSLECLSFKDREPVRAISLPLGCVRLTERLVADPAQPLSPEDDAKIRAYVSDALREAGLDFAPAGTPAVFCGGTVTTTRAIVAEARNLTLKETQARVTAELLAALLKKLGRLPLAERQQIPGLPARRADVMPTALATVLALAEFGGFEAFQHSFYNLRWGIASEALTLP